jgi:hypothetical protein
MAVFLYVFGSELDWLTSGLGGESDFPRGFEALPGTQQSY